MDNTVKSASHFRGSIFLGRRQMSASLPDDTDLPVAQAPGLPVAVPELARPLTAAE